MTGILYVVATPIGNFEDITLRALRILKEVDLILAEDTRVTSNLLKHYDMENHILNYHQHSSDSRKFEILQNIIAGKNIALVTDAGTPGVSDPGNELISFILKNSPVTKIVPIPGASAISTAISVSGMNLSKFSFVGFVPKKSQLNFFKDLKVNGLPVVFYESPFRILKTLESIMSVCGEETEVFIGRELTKMFESHYRGSVKEVLEELRKEKIKGEIVGVIDIRY